MDAAKIVALLKDHQWNLRGCVIGITICQILYDIDVYVNGFSWFTYIWNLTMFANILVVMINVTRVYAFWRIGNISSVVPLLILELGALTIMLIFKVIVWHATHLYGAFEMAQFMLLVAAAVSSYAGTVTSWRVYSLLRITGRIEAWLADAPSPPTKDVSPLEMCLTPQEIQTCHAHSASCAQRASCHEMQFEEEESTISQTEDHRIMDDSSNLPLLQDSSPFRHNVDQSKQPRIHLYDPHLP